MLTIRGISVYVSSFCVQWSSFILCSHRQKSRTLELGVQEVENKCVCASNDLACRTGVIFCVFQGNRSKREMSLWRVRGEREARVVCKRRIAKKSHLSPYHCSSCSGIQIWTRLPNWWLWNTWSSNVFPICITITYMDLNTTDQFTLQLFGEFNWKYGPIGLICSL